MLGSGPGTFGVSYKTIKAPEAEMTRLVHNDFLQQGSDSGWIGLMAYAVWVLGGVLFISRKGISHRLFFGAWLGLAGIAAQSFVEFGLFIPALAWPFFLLFGWLAGVGNPANQIDRKTTPA
jgi:O-antigen ligase